MIGCNGAAELRWANHQRDLVLDHDRDTDRNTDRNTLYGMAHV